MENSVCEECAVTDDDLVREDGRHVMEPEPFAYLRDIDASVHIPPPPAMDSLRFQEDIIRFREGRTLLGTKSYLRTVHDIILLRLINALGHCFGCRNIYKNSPELFSFLERSAHTLAKAGHAAKRKYIRVRPYVFFNVSIGFPKEEENLRANGSYPSGHAIRSWGLGLILAEIVPASADRILQRAYEAGQSRVINGFHWQSDVDAGRYAAGVALAKLHANESFCEALEKFKAEHRRV